jgi:DNA-binding response OmpR family regulator
MSLALEHHPDGILVDLEMPEEAGVELCQTLRSVSFTSQIPIFAIAEKNSSVPNSQFPELGVASVFERPVNLEEIKNRLIYVLEGPRPNRRVHPRIRMRTILKLRGNDASGNHFDELTATENVSVGGFLCNSTTPLELRRPLAALRLPLRRKVQRVGGARVAGLTH